MAAVAANELREVARVPVLPENGIVALPLLPHVKRLVHHHKPHLVAEIEKRGGRRIVRSAYRITAHLLQKRKLATREVAVKGRAYRPEVVVQANALHLAVYAIQEEPLLRIEDGSTYAVAEFLSE